MLKVDSSITGRGEDRLRAFARELGEPSGLLTLTGDASDWDTVRSAVEATVEAFGRLDTVVANAGYTNFDDVAGGDPAAWRHMVLTNVLGPALLIRAALPHLKETRGRIVLRQHGGHRLLAGQHLRGDQVGGDRPRREHQTHGHERRRRRDPDQPGGHTHELLRCRRRPPDRAMLTADQLAGCIVWATNQPSDVDVNTITVRPVGSPL